MVVVVPLWFFEFGSTMYFLAAIIGLLLTYFSFKLFNLTGKTQHFLLNAGFIFITAGFLAMLVGNYYSYANFESCNPNCAINPTMNTYFWIRFGNYGYYAATLIGYVLLALSYWYSTNRKKSIIKFLPVVGMTFLFQQPGVFVLFPFVNEYFQIFHILSILIISYIVTKTWVNYSKTKTENSLLVLSGFVAIDFYHVLMYLIPYYATSFALAHLALLAGFGSLLVMLIRVNRK